MQKLLKKLKNLSQKIKFLFPHTLPIYKEELPAFIDKVCEVYSLPDHPSYKEAVATAILHLKHDQDKARPLHFAKVIRKRMASQISYDLIQDIKDAQKKEDDRLKQEATKIASSLNDDSAKEKASS